MITKVILNANDAKCEGVKVEMSEQEYYNLLDALIRAEIHSGYTGEKQLEHDLRDIKEDLKNRTYKWID